MSILERLRDGSLCLPFRAEETVDRDGEKVYWLVLDRDSRLVSVEKSEAMARGALMRIERELKILNDKAQSLKNGDV